jgi:uncharacterized membrane protein YkvA (DUF1232 family)
MTWWRLLVGLVAGLVLAWALLLIALARVANDGSSWRDKLRLVPDVVGLLRRMAADETLPRGVRVRLWLLLAYLAMPVDIVPDFLPVIGYADDAVVAALVLRSVARRAGKEALTRHWHGTSDGLAAVLWLAGCGPPTSTPTPP